MLVGLNKGVAQPKRGDEKWDLVQVTSDLGLKLECFKSHCWTFNIVSTLSLIKIVDNDKRYYIEKQTEAVSLSLS